MKRPVSFQKLRGRSRVCFSRRHRFEMASVPTVEPQIIDVWQDNLDEAFEDIMDLINDHTLIGMV